MLLGLVTPLVAALAMSGSSILVVGNACASGARRDERLALLIPLALLRGLAGLAAFFSALGNGQFDDMDGAALRILIDEPPEPPEIPIG